VLRAVRVPIAAEALFGHGAACERLCGAYGQSVDHAEAGAVPRGDQPLQGAQPFLVSYQEFLDLRVPPSTWARTKPTRFLGGAHGGERPRSQAGRCSVADPFLGRRATQVGTCSSSDARQDPPRRYRRRTQPDLRAWEFGGSSWRAVPPFLPFVFGWEGEWYMMPDTSACDESGSTARGRFHASGYSADLAEGVFGQRRVEREGAWFMLTSPRMETLQLFNVA